MSVSIKVLAYTVPAICMVLGFLLIFVGLSTENDGMTRSGWMVVIIGFILQVLWLLTRRR